MAKYKVKIYYKINGKDREKTIWNIRRDSNFHEDRRSAENEAVSILKKKLEEIYNNNCFIEVERVFATRIDCIIAREEVALS